MTVPEIIEQLKAHLDVLYAVDVGDLVPNAAAAHRQRSIDVQKVISGLMNEPRDVADEQADIEAWQARREAYLQKQSELEQAIAASPDVDTIADARQRSAEYQRQWTLKRQLQLLRDGALILPGNVSLGSLAYIEQRIKEPTARRDQIQSALDAHLRQAEQILAADTVTS